MEIQTKRLGFASWLKEIKNYPLVDFNNNSFSFEVPEGETLNKLEVEYSNTCCARHDAGVCTLRRLKKPKFNN